MASRNLFLCPHCNAKLKQVNSKQEHSLFRIAYFNCENHFCGFTARGEFSITHQISPSAIPNPNVNLESLRGKALAVKVQ